jgi:hypothetical protein
MAAVKIGSNGPILQTRQNLDFYVGVKITALKVALREAHNAKLLVDQVVNADLLALGYGDGNNGTANEIGYLRAALAACQDLDLLRLGQQTTQAPATNAANGYVYENDLKYACQSE